MSEKVTVELPDDLAQRVRAAAARSSRRLEDVLLEWIGRAADEPAVEFLSDEEVLALCDSQLASDEQEQLSDLLVLNREEQLTQDERRQLDALMTLYRKGLARKAQALRVAVSRGLRPRLG